MNLCCAVPRSWLHHKATFEYFWRRKSVYPPLLEELKHRCESKLEVNLPPLFECMESRKVAACILLRPKSSYDYCSVYSGMQHSHLWLCIANQPFSAYIYLPIYNPASIPGLQIPQSQIPGWSKRSSIHWNSYSYLGVPTIGVGSVFEKWCSQKFDIRSRSDGFPTETVCNLQLKLKLDR